MEEPAFADDDPRLQQRRGRHFSDSHHTFRMDGKLLDVVDCADV
jgi:hypothetical protein